MLISFLNKKDQYLPISFLMTVFIIQTRQIDFCPNHLLILPKFYLHEKP